MHAILFLKSPSLFKDYINSENNLDNAHPEDFLNSCRIDYILLHM